MNRFKKIFHKKEERKKAPVLPPWEEIVETMVDRQLNFVDRVVRVIYSKDKERRYVITQNEAGLLFYHLQKLYAFDEDEWQYIGGDENALPGYWSQDHNDPSQSVFDSIDDLMNDLRSGAEYRLYFDDNEINSAF